MDFLTFILEYRALVTFLAEFINGLDKAMLRATCRKLYEGIEWKSGAINTGIYAAYLGHYYLVEEYFKIRPSHHLLFSKCSGRDFEVQKKMITDKMVDEIRPEYLPSSYDGFDKKSWENQTVWSEQYGKNPSEYVKEVVLYSGTSLNPTSERICPDSAGNGHLELLKWAVANDAPFGDACKKAAEFGHLNILKWAWANDRPPGYGIYFEAFDHGHQEIITWAQTNKVSWNEEFCAIAALYGRLKILQWARANGCPWNEIVCAVAISVNNLEILKWARENGAPWSEEIKELAAKKGYVDDF